jgi:zinc and cadmium transporter
MNLISDAVHNLIDGMLIGASYCVSIPIGIATTVAVVLHEIPQEMGDFAVLITGGFRGAGRSSSTSSRHSPR